jgi:hypothetical protein
MSSGSKKKEAKYARLHETKASHSQRMWAEVSSSAPHLLHSGRSDSPIKWRCLLRVLCPVRRPITALDCILLKDRSLALAPRQGPEISSWACLWVSPRPRPVHRLLLSVIRTCLIHTPFLIVILIKPHCCSWPHNEQVVLRGENTCTVPHVSHAVILPSMPGSPQWSLSPRFPYQNPVHASPLPYTRYMPCPSHSSPFYHPHNIGWGVQNIKLLIT